MVARRIEIQGKAQLREKKALKVEIAGAVWIVNVQDARLIFRKQA